MKTQRWFELTIAFTAALVIGVLVGYWFGHSPTPVRRYTIGHYGGTGSGISSRPSCLYRYDTHTGKTWQVTLGGTMQWIEIAEP